MSRRPAPAVVAVATCLVAALVPAAALAADPSWPPPVVAPVVDPFREPACPWCPGNRGIEYGTAPGVVVRAVAAGTVTYAGVVAGVRYVVVEHAGALRATYGNLATALVGAGDRVVRGSPVGTTAGPFHFGVRRGERYVDPEPLIGVWRGVVRLVPADGSAAPPAPPPQLVCGAAGAPGATTPGTTRSRGFAARVR